MEQDQTSEAGTRDVPGKIDPNTGNIFEKIDNWIDGFFLILPNIGIAIVVFFLIWGAGIAVAKLIRRAARNRDRESLAEVGSSMIKWGFFILAVMIAVTIIAPSISPVDLFGALGVSSVAIGFAFKDILQNMLAGVLILLRQPFEVGDQIVSQGHEGTVEKIETRATFIKTYDGRRVVIPNADIYTDAVVVNTAFDKRRSQLDVGVGCSEDWENAKELLLQAVRVEGVLDDPGPEAIPVELGDSANVIRLRWWTNPDRASVIHVRGRVIQSVYSTLDDAGIDQPYPTNVVLFHDQTEEWDGVRSRQREGWPARPGEDDPQPARRALFGADKTKDTNKPAG